MHHITQYGDKEQTFAKNTVCKKDAVLPTTPATNHVQKSSEATVSAEFISKNTKYLVFISACV